MKKIIIIISIPILILLFILYVNNEKKYNNRFYYNKNYKESYDLYLKQLNILYNDFNVQTVFNNDKKIMFFGMGNRKKILYKDGILYDIKNNNKIIKKYNIDKEMIIPNEYTVSILTKDKKEIIIYENENGIFINDNNNIQIIDDSIKINLLDFNDKKYSEVLKVLHQEILFNIYNSKLIPNILVYNDAWYRDAMMASMVLEKSNNTNLIKEWVDSIDRIYDEQNGNKEVDNLGELLYLLSVTNSNNIIEDKIYEEINKIKNNNSIGGIIDGHYKNYYPTAIALFASEKRGKKIELSLQEEDSYSELVWYFDENKKYNTYVDSKEFPYLGWASYHTNRKSALYNCDELYPLSYESKAGKAIYNDIPNNLYFYKIKKVSPTHIWDAAEKFLLLYEEKI